LTKIQKSVNLLLRERELIERQIQDVKSFHGEITKNFDELTERLDKNEDIMEQMLVEIRDLNKENREQNKLIAKQQDKLEKQEQNTQTLVEALKVTMDDMMALRRDYSKLHDTVN
jgi:chromosome segregation ATPase